MTFGILKDKHLEKVPGTELLSDLGIVRGNEVAVDEAVNLKRGTGRHAHIVLIPQPSDDPRDPLNWPRWKKEACFWALLFVTSLDGTLSPLASAGYVLLSEQFQVSVDEITSSFGSVVLGLGCFMLLQGALAEKFGQRIVYLGSVFLMFVSCIWCAASPSLVSIRVSRVFQGFGMSAFQSLTATTIEQIYFVHERGERTTLWTFSILAGITLGPFVYSFVIQHFSWQLGFWFISIPLGLGTAIIFFFFPETTFHRPSTSNETPTPETASESDDTEKGRPSLKESSSALQEEATPSLAVSPPSYISQLRIWNGTFSNENLLKIFLRPFPFLFSPVTYFVFLVYGMQTVWLSLVPLCSSTIFTIEYNFNPSQIGLTNLAGLVGILLGLFTAGPAIDWGVIWMSKRNGGVFEPEFRLVFVSTMLFGVFGYVGWAVGNSHHMPWIGAVACIAMLNFSMIFSGSAAITYALDTHGPNALHVLTLSNFAKNMVLFGTTFFANGMVINRGVKVSLLVLGACHTFCWLSSVLMYIFGKRTRSFIARHPALFSRERS